MVTRTEAELASKRILGEGLYIILQNARISLPEILKQAALKCFMENINNDYSRIIQAALIDLSVGKFLIDV